MSLIQRAKSAWNAFMSRAPTAENNYGPGYAYQHASDSTPVQKRQQSCQFRTELLWMLPPLTSDMLKLTKMVDSLRKSIPNSTTAFRRKRTSTRFPEILFRTLYLQRSMTERPLWYQYTLRLTQNIRQVMMSARFVLDASFSGIQEMFV